MIVRPCAQIVLALPDKCLLRSIVPFRDERDLHLQYFVDTIQKYDKTEIFLKPMIVPYTSIFALKSMTKNNIRDIPPQYLCEHVQLRALTVLFTEPCSCGNKRLAIKKRGRLKQCLAL